MCSSSCHICVTSSISAYVFALLPAGIVMNICINLNYINMHTYMHSINQKQYKDIYIVTKTDVFEIEIH